MSNGRVHWNGTRRVLWRLVGYPLAVILVWAAIVWSLRASAEEPSGRRAAAVSRRVAAANPSTVHRVISDYFADKRGYEPGDLITREDVREILERLADHGVVPRDAEEIVEDSLEEGAFLVQLLSSERGRRFMRKTKKEKLIYDRLDRIAAVPQGKKTLRNVVRLPDGHRYAPIRPARGTPTLLDLLPKRGSSRTRSIKDYTKPTGKIYTQSDLEKRLLKHRR